MPSLYRNHEDHELATKLAVDAIKGLGEETTFTVSTVLDTNKPETVRGFEILKRLLFEAYIKGQSDRTEV